MADCRDRILFIGHPAEFFFISLGICVMREYLPLDKVAKQDTKEYPQYLVDYQRSSDIVIIQDIISGLA